MSILPSKKRPNIVPSTKKKAPSVRKAKVKASSKSETNDPED